MNSISFSGGTLIVERDNKEMQFNIEDLYFIYNEDYFNVMLDESHKNSGLAVFSSMYSDLLVDGEAFTGGADELETLVKSHIGGGGEITIDAALDANSPNAVANSAITTAMNSKENHLTDVVKTWQKKYNYATSGSSSFDVVYFTYRLNNEEVTGYVPFAKINGNSVMQTTLFNLIETSAIQTTLSSSSTDAQVPSAKAVYDALGNIETLLSQI